jgi:heme oxygenase (biliverdin-IX-beta and delta-forming)
LIDLQPSARDALRAATRDVHERLHEHPRLKPLADGRIGLDAYREMLARLYGFHASVEAAFARAAHLAPIDMAARCKTPLLVSDLDALGCGNVERLPLCADLPAIDSAAAFLGCAYVVEGSTLGGRALARAVAPLLGDGVAGRRFLLGYGERHGAMWRAFTDALETAPPAQHVAMTDAAAATFAAFERWLD